MYMYIFRTKNTVTTGKNGTEEMEPVIVLNTNGNAEKKLVWNLPVWTVSYITYRE